jgi:Spy/CpxP family protein refolding chaperone
MKERVCSVRRFPLVLALLLTLSPVPSAAQGKWWQSERFQRELHLTHDQINRIEAVFQEYVPHARQHKQTLDTLEKELSRLIDTADEAAVMQQANRVETARAEMSKARTRMLVRIRKVLNADQRVKLTALHQEWERDRKRRDRHDR